MTFKPLHDLGSAHLSTHLSHHLSCHTAFFHSTSAHWTLCCSSNMLRTLAFFPLSDHSSLYSFMVYSASFKSLSKQGFSKSSSLTNLPKIYPITFYPFTLLNFKVNISQESKQESTCIMSIFLPNTRAQREHGLCLVHHCFYIMYKQQTLKKYVKEQMMVIVFSFVEKIVTKHYQHSVRLSNKFILNHKSIHCTYTLMSRVQCS